METDVLTSDSKILLVGSNEGREPGVELCLYRGVSVGPVMQAPIRPVFFAT